MGKDWTRGQAYVKAPKIEKELGVGKDGYQTGGVTIEATDPLTSQTVNVLSLIHISEPTRPY